MFVAKGTSRVDQNDIERAGYAAMLKAVIKDEDIGAECFLSFFARLRPIGVGNVGNIGQVSPNETLFVIGETSDGFVTAGDDGWFSSQINQTACNKDLSCVNGFCPAFVMISGAELKSTPMVGLGLGLDELRSRAPLPKLPIDDGPVSLIVAGVGGTGVVTLSALLGTAAHLDGKAVSTLDMTGLAQKGGAVFAHVRIANDVSQLHGTRVATGGTDVLLACDLIAGTSTDALKLLCSERTRVVVNTTVMPTAQFVLQQHNTVDADARMRRLDEFARSVLAVDAAGLVTELMGQGVNAVTGDYSRGVVGYWIENGEICYPVNEITIAGNLKDLYHQITAIGNDQDLRSGIRCGSLLVDAMTIAGS